MIATVNRDTVSTRELHQEFFSMLDSMLVESGTPDSVLVVTRQSAYLEDPQDEKNYNFLSFEPFNMDQETVAHKMHKFKRYKNTKVSFIEN